MSFWSTEKFELRAPTDQIVTPYDRVNLKHGAYELAVGAEAFITSADVKEELKEGQQIAIHSGQFGLLITEEIVNVPNSAIGFISIRAGIKFMGLVNVSGFHVDPGFRGRLKFAVYNAGSRDITLERGERIFMLWLSDLDRNTQDCYKGEHVNQLQISAKDIRQLQGEIASPAALKKEIEEVKNDLEKKISSLEKDVSLWRGIFIALLLAILGPCFRETFITRPKPGEGATLTPTKSATPQKAPAPNAATKSASPRDRGAQQNDPPVRQLP